MRSLKKILFGLVLGTSAHLAQAFPDKQVVIVVPFPAGGVTDVQSRVVAERLAERWGKPVIVENRVGAGGTIGTGYVLRQPADGHTILMQSPAVMISAELLRDNAGYRSAEDFVAFTDAFASPVVLVASGGTSARNARDFFEEARKAGNFSFASHGYGSSTQYIGERLKIEAKVPLIHVPMAGESQMVTNLIGGHVTTAFMSASGAKKALDSGSAWLVAVTGTSRWPAFPQVPTFRELGLSKMDRMTGAKYFVRKGTPPELIQRLSADFALAIKDPKSAEATKALGVTPATSTPEKASQDLSAELAEWKESIREFGNLTNAK
ncbi:Bug family tripartite tricarboxylate transporter substrate binding protein [Ottowia sp. VDI28]|uniref:Bug family tripartite tricarboxylate transporter substrate binding protein n=1 Tax=Ottowia sp. VDI28 TaxID=3133968 RepID=UPI003C2F72D1